MKCSQAHNTTNASYILVYIRQIICLLINDGIQNGYQSRKELTYSFFSFIFTCCFSKFLCLKIFNMYLFSVSKF